MSFLFTYQECLELFKNDFQIKKALQKKILYKIKPGIYSSKKNHSDLEVFIKEHPNIIFTMESAFFFHGMADEIPDIYYVATSKNATKLPKKETKQYFIDERIINIGKTFIKYNNHDQLPVYDKERLLIELIRYKNKLPFDYYKEVINYYRDHISEIDLPKLLDYLKHFPKKDLINEVIQLEVL